MADTVHSNASGDSVPLCVEGIKAAFQEFMAVLETVLQTEEKRLGLERSYLNEQRCEAEAWSKQSADQFRLWKAATERVEAVCADLRLHRAGLSEERAGLTQERECLEEAAETARKMFAGTTGCHDLYAAPLRSATDIVSLARMDAAVIPLNEHPLDEIYRGQRSLSCPSFDLPPAAFDSVLPLQPTFNPEIRLPRRESPMQMTPASGPIRNFARAPATSPTGVIAATAASPELIVSTSPPQQLVTPIKCTDGGVHWPSPGAVPVHGVHLKAPSSAYEAPPLIATPTSAIPMPDEPDEELVPSREVSKEQRRTGDLWVLHEELDI